MSGWWTETFELGIGSKGKNVSSVLSLPRWPGNRCETLLFIPEPSKK